jgi:peptide/nickel transport system ATP-binding protein
VACFLGGLQTLLEVRGLSKTFEGTGGLRLPVVRQASLSLQEGEVLALVGQTGSGKSTLAKLIVGLLAPDEGEVRLEGRGLFGAEQALRRRVQLVVQDPFDALSPRLPVVELVREPLDIMEGDIPFDEREERSRRALADVRLPTTEEFLAKRTHELSGGQLQRVAIARALVLRPKVLIADEPVSMLDPSEQARVIRLLKDLQNEHGMGLLLISHDLALVRKVADRIAVMHQGSIIEQGSAEQILRRPKDSHTRYLVSAAGGVELATGL